MSEQSSRIASLDGLRGVAALIVVFYHLSLVARPEVSETAWRALTQSPLKLMFAGTEWVLVFFALSGLVVTLPALRPGFDWVRYYPTRVLRLMLPVVAALAFAAALIAVFPRDPSTMPEGSWMRSAQASEVTASAFLGEASLLQASYDINNVLWSLRWELFFSLLLPVFVWLAIRGRRHWPVVAAVSAVATIAGRVLGVDALVYYPVFLLGALAAVRIDALRRVAATVRARWLWPSLGVVAGVLLVLSWLARPVVPGGTVVADALWGLAGIGAALAVVLAIVWPALRRLLERPATLWLGRISFGLYLVHAPLIGTVGYLVGPDRWWLTVLVALPLSVAVAWAFHRWVERPTHRLARAGGEHVASFVRRVAAVPQRRNA